MSKNKTCYVCSACGAQSSKWAGKCSSCNQWNTLNEERVPVNDSKRTGYAGSGSGGGAEVKKLSSVVTSKNTTRYTSHNAELDRVLGGGFVDGEVVIIGGDPGIGKSTLLTQTISLMSQTYAGLYVSGEESEQQIAMRAQRLGLNVDGVNVYCEVEVEAIIASLERNKPKVVIIDSIQTIYSSSIESSTGSVSQVRECAAQLTRYAKETGTIIILVGHVTKEGAIAGPRVLEHIVDAVLYFEGDPQMSFRILRAFKNRFGSIGEIGVFSMSDKGLSAVSNPSALFLTYHKNPVSGACVTAIAEGTRPLMLEIQALVEDTSSPNATRVSVGIDPGRLKMILAVLTKHVGISVHDLNIFLNVTSGVRIGETGADLPSLLAILSSIRNKPLPPKLVCFGEIGLTGEIRQIQRGAERVQEASKLGFDFAIIPSGNVPSVIPPGLTIKPVDSLAEALQALEDIYSLI